MMKEIAKRFLEEKHTAPWIEDPSAEALVDYVYNGGVWDKDARAKYPAIQAKQSTEWHMEDVLAYLTFIVVQDRTCDGFIDKHIANGTVSALLNRYLELEEETI